MIEIGDLVKTAMWFGVVVGTDGEDYNVHFFFPDNRPPNRWCSEKEIKKWKRDVDRIRIVE